MDQSFNNVKNVYVNPDVFLALCLERCNLKYIFLFLVSVVLTQL